MTIWIIFFAIQIHIISAVIKLDIIIVTIDAVAVDVIVTGAITIVTVIASSSGRFNPYAPVGS